MSYFILFQEFYYIIITFYYIFNSIKYLAVAISCNMLCFMKTDVNLAAPAKSQVALNQPNALHAEKGWQQLFAQFSTDDMKSHIVN